MVFGGVSLSYTRTMLVFCNLANWSQYFLSKSDSSWTWVKWFANRTKNLEWHPGMGQCLHFSFFMLTGRMLDTNWVKLFATRNLLLIFKGRSGRKGRKGTFLTLCFFPWARVEISREGCVGSRAWETHSCFKSENYKKRVFYKVFYLWITHITIFDTHIFINTAIYFQHNFIYLEA